VTSDTIAKLLNNAIRILIRVNRLTRIYGDVWPAYRDYCAQLVACKSHRYLSGIKGSKQGEKERPANQFVNGMYSSLSFPGTTANDRSVTCTGNANFKRVWQIDRTRANEISFALIDFGFIICVLCNAQFVLHPRFVF